MRLVSGTLPRDVGFKLNARCPNCGSLAIFSRVVNKCETEFADPLEYANQEIRKKVTHEYPYYQIYGVAERVVQIVVYCDGCGYTEVFTVDELEES